jgi:hypothetical protein
MCGLTQRGDQPLALVVQRVWHDRRDG